MVSFVVSTGWLMLGARQVSALDPIGIVSYQGRVLDGNGVPVADASLDIVFKLVSDSAGTACYWSNSSATCASATAMAVTLTDGLFSVNLGDTGSGFAAAIPNSVFSDDASVYLEVIIEGETLTPRKLITAAPYALNSQTLDGVDSTGFLASTGDTAAGNFNFLNAIFTGAKPLTFEGLTSDAFQTIFDITDPTIADKTITFKDESGTVAYLSDVTAAASKWTDGGALTILTSTTDNLAVGGNATTSSSFAVDVAANSVYVGSGAAANGNIIFKGSDGDTGTLTYDTNDTFVFTGGDASFSNTVTANDYACTTGDCIDFTELEDTLDLDAALILNQGGNTWTQNFTGAATTGLSYVANSLTTGTGASFSSSSLTDGTVFSVSSSSTAINLGSVFSADHSATYTAPGTLDRSTAVFSRTLVSDTGGDIEAIEPVVTISNSVSTVNAGVISSAGYLLKLDQNSTVGQGALVISDSGLGESIVINKTTDETAISINASTATNNVLELAGNALTSGNGILVTVDSSLTTGNAFKIDYEDAAPTNDRLFQIESDCTGDATCSGVSDNNSVFRIMASGEAVSDVGFTAGGASTNYYDGKITSSSAFSYSSPTSFTFQDDASNSLMVISDGGTVGNVSMTGDLTVTGDNVDSAGAPLVLNAVAGDEVRIGSGAPGIATNAGDFFVTGATEIDGLFTVGQHSAFGAGGVVSPDVVMNISESFPSGAGYVSKSAFATLATVTGNGNGTNLSGGEFKAENQTVAGTLNNLRGILVTASENGVGSTVNDLMGVDATANRAAGTALRAYGIRATATNANNNYAGYFYGAAVHVDNNATPSAPSFSTGAGDLYVYNQFEIDGAGITNGTVMDVRPASLDTGTGAQFIFDKLTTGTGLLLTKTTDGVTDFTNTTTGLVHFGITELNATGDLLFLDQDGSGKALKIDQAGDSTALDVTATNTTDYIAKFFNDGNADTNMGLSIQACLDTNPTAACDFVKFFDGNGTVLGAIEGNGAGGVTNASTGSDYAELFLGQLESLSEGDIIALGTNGQVMPATEGSTIIGAYSIAPNTLGNWVENWDSRSDLVPVALLGQVPVKVSTEGGPITAGDFISISSVPGVGRKASGVGFTLGRALESFNGNTGTIQVFIAPGWQAGSVLMANGAATEVNSDLVVAETGAATAIDLGAASHALALRGAAWEVGTSVPRQMVLQAEVTDADNYRLSIANDLGDEVAQITDSGDLAVAGRIYPSDRGQLQTEKYIYYDGSDGAGGDLMRTNASGWASGSYDFAEMFPSNDALSPGEVVVFATDDEHVTRSSGATYDQRIAGIISTRPGFLAGENNPGDVPVALAGRVPTYVSGENGPISVGDPLTTSTRPGYAMKATEPGPIVGYAMEPFSGTTGVLVAVVRPSYYDGGPVEEAAGAQNLASGLMTVTGLDVSGALNMNNGTIVNIGSLSGVGDAWTLSENGDFTTHGRLIELVRSYQNEDVETYAVTSRETTIQLSGTVNLQNGLAQVTFEQVDPGFNDIISDVVPYRVFLTPSGATGQLYTADRSLLGFEIRDASMTTGVTVDWMVVAYHKDFAPDQTLSPSEPVEEVGASTGGEASEMPAAEEPIVEPTTTEPSPGNNEEVVPEPDIVVPTEPTVEVVPEPEVVAEEPAVVEPTPEPTTEAESEAPAPEPTAEPVVESTPAESISEPSAVTDSAATP